MKVIRAYVLRMIWSLLMIVKLSRLLRKEVDLKVARTRLNVVITDLYLLLSVKGLRLLIKGVYPRVAKP